MNISAIQAPHACAYHKNSIISLFNNVDGLSRPKLDKYLNVHQPTRMIYG